jgi:hypothetical protein
MKKPSLQQAELCHFLVAQEGGFICHYCHASLVPPDAEVGCQLYYQNKYVQGRFVGYEIRPEFRVATIDHKIPVCRDGAEYAFTNMVLACRQCNQEKSDLPYAWFYALKRKEREAQDLWCEKRFFVP